MAAHGSTTVHENDAQAIRMAMDHDELACPLHRTVVRTPGRRLPWRLDATIRQPQLNNFKRLPITKSQRSSPGSGSRPALAGCLKMGKETL